MSERIRSSYDDAIIQIDVYFTLRTYNQLYVMLVKRLCVCVSWQSWAYSHGWWFWTGGWDSVKLDGAGDGEALSPL